MFRWVEVNRDEAKAHRLYGIKNWLAVFLLAVLINLGRDWSEISRFAQAMGITTYDLLAHGEEDFVVWFRWCLWIDLIGLSIIYCLAALKAKKFRTVSTLVVMLSWPLSCIVGLSQDISPTFRDVIVYFIYAGVWGSYLNFSERVRVTFEYFVRVRQPKALSTADIPAAAWEKALVEFESDARLKGVWASAFAESQGNEMLAKSKYLARRSMEIHQEAISS